jgi:hypothetical protein
MNFMQDTPSFCRIENKFERNAADMSGVWSFVICSNS